MKRFTEGTPTDKLQKAYNKRLMLSIIPYTLLAVALIIGFFIALEKPSIGMLILIPSVALTVLLTVLLVRIRKHLHPLILNGLIRDMRVAYEKDSNAREFTAADGTVITIINGKISVLGSGSPDRQIGSRQLSDFEVSPTTDETEFEISPIMGAMETSISPPGGSHSEESTLRIDPKKVTAYAVMRIMPRLIHDDFYPLIIIKTKALSYELPLTASLRSALMECGIRIQNESEINSFLADPEPVFRRLLKYGAMCARPISLPLDPRDKNAPPVSVRIHHYTADISVEEHNTVNAIYEEGDQNTPQSTDTNCENDPPRKKSMIPMLVCIGVIALIFLSKRFGFNITLIVNLAASVALLCAAFVKPEGVTLTAKICFVASAALLWTKFIGLTARPYILIALILATVIGADCVIRYAKHMKMTVDRGEKPKFKPPIRSFTVFGFLMLICTGMLEQITFASDLQLLIGVGVTAAILMLLTIPVVFHLARLEKPMKIRKKSEIAILASSILLFSVLFGFIVFSTLNCALDFSDPKPRSAVVTEVYKGSSDSSPSVTAIYNEKKISITIDEEDLDKITEGSVITFREYNGAFGVKYYIK